MKTKAYEFLKKHGMDIDAIDPVVFAEKMRDDMENGLKGEKSAMPMIPTYITPDGEIPLEEYVAVIDAGGTNFRCGLGKFTQSGFELVNVEKHPMPGIKKPATWEEFISFTADKIQPFMDKTDFIGFCFSYNADITKDIDGKVKRIDKEVVITGSAGKLVGASLVAELEGRGLFGKRVFVLNDTVAALLGSSYKFDKSQYSGFIGQISGTGVNTCCALPYKRIAKLADGSEEAILINLESGLYDGFPQSYFDKQLDAQSNNPGEKIMEKMVAGVYLGKLGRLILQTAAEEGLLSEEACIKLSSAEKKGASIIDAWSCGEKLELVCATEEDKSFVSEMAMALFDRAARCLCANLGGILLLTDKGQNPEKPVCVCAEGSLIDKSRYFKPLLEKYLAEYTAEKMGRYAVLRIGYETTLPGSAAAALLNK